MNTEPRIVVQVEPVLVTREVAADLLGLSSRTVDTLIADGRLPVVRVGRSVRLRVSDLRAWADAQVEQAGDGLRLAE